MERLMTPKEVADLVRVPENTLRHWRQTGAGPKSARVGRHVVYRRRDVETWLDQQFAGSGAA